MKQILAFTLVLAASAGFSFGATITSTLGIQNHADTAGATFVAAFDVTGETASPFNQTLIGFDADAGDGGSDFDATWTHTYAPILQTITSATITFGLWEHDSGEPGDQVGLFSLNTTNNLTLQANTALNATGGTTDSFTGNSEYNVYTITLPAAVYTALATGGAQFRLQLQGPVESLFGPVAFNGAAIDFATLTINTRDGGTTGPEIPEPATFVLAGVALPLLWALRRR